MGTLSKVLDRMSAAIENAGGLDKPAAAVSGAMAKAIPDGAVKNALSGTWLGHPLHPLLVALPIGAWTSASVLDLNPKYADAARTLVGIGLATASVTAATGASDYTDTEGAEKRVGLVHWAGAWTSIALYATSYLQRGRGGSGRWTALAGAATLAATGYLGGHLAYALGVGVDTTAFDGGPEDWTRVASAGEVRKGELTQVKADGVAVLLTRRDGTVLAIADRCTHRGGPLSDGEIDPAGCVVCPWHGSAFALDTGDVVRGPATRPQPVYEVKLDDGAVYVRRAEQRSLRGNPA